MTTLSAPDAKRTETTQFTIGAKVSCRSGHCGKLTRVIIDPIRRTLTHIVVEPNHHELGRLVPLNLVEAASAEQIALACTLAQFDELDYGGLGYGWGWGPETTTYEAIPSGEVTIRRGDPVRATDGDIGKVAGLVIGTATGGVTHVLLQEGHLWGKKDVAIPIRSANRIAGVVEVALSKDQLGDLPTVNIDHPEARQPT